MVKKILQKLTIIFALIFVFIPKNTYAQSDIGSFKYSKEITNITLYSGNIVKATNTYYMIDGPAYAPSFVTNSSFDYNEGDIFTFSYYILDFSEYSYVNGSNNPPTCLGSGYWLTVINCDMNMGFVNRIDTNNFNIGISGSESGTYNSNSGVISINNSRYYIDTLGLNYIPEHFYYFNYTVKANHNRTGATTLDFQNNLVNLNNTGNKFSIIIPSRNFQVFSGVPNAGKEMEKDKQENQQQGEQSQTNSNQAGGDVQQNTTNVLNAITGFFSAFTSARPTNCNMDWGLENYGFGVINMCQNPIPQEFQVVLSIVSLLFVVPMILWLFSSIINAFKEFQS